MKFRFGYGENGNQTNRFASQATVGPNTSYVYGDGGTTQFGQQVTALGNPDLKWERTAGLNAGVDFALLKNRLTGSFDFYNNNTSDLLWNLALPSLTGFGSISTNIGKLNNYYLYSLLLILNNLL